ncbi:MAG: hypothetical protein ASARMPRED_003038 [Alectoria sarmentosa]|nr:MAG: hypothetical protein ASARMPRED_003038 [Alectoria sarmentosa]
MTRMDVGLAGNLYRNAASEEEEENKLTISDKVSKAQRAYARTVKVFVEPSSKAVSPGLDSTDLAGAGKKDVVSANYPPGTENYITETSASIELTGDAEEQPSQLIQNPRCIAKRDYEPEPGFQTCAIKTHRDQEPLAQMTSDDDEDDDQRSHPKPHGDTAGQETGAKRRIQVQQIEGMPGQDIQDYSQLKRDSIPQPSAPAWTLPLSEPRTTSGSLPVRSSMEGKRDASITAPDGTSQAPPQPNGLPGHPDDRRYSQSGKDLGRGPVRRRDTVQNVDKGGTLPLGEKERSTATALENIQKRALEISTGCRAEESLSSNTDSAVSAFSRQAQQANVFQERRMLNDTVEENLQTSNIATSPLDENLVDWIQTTLQEI